MPPDSTADGRRVLACDLDGTVVSVNTFPHFVRFLLAQLVAQRRFGAATRLAGSLVLRKLARLDHLTFKRVVDDIGQQADEERVREWAGTVIERWVQPEVKRLIDTWDGERYLVTAAPETYARFLAERLEFPHVHGSRWEDGTYVENVGVAKLRRLAAVGLDRVDTAVTDDPVLDGPLLSIADRAVTVVDGKLSVQTAVA